MKCNKKHCFLAPSSSHRWLVCPPIEKLEALEPQEDSNYAQEGSVAHELAYKFFKKFKLMWVLHSENLIDSELTSIASRLIKYKKSSYTEEMIHHVKDYVRYCTNYIKTIYEQKVNGDSNFLNFFVEKKVDLSPWVPQGFGTVDVIVLAKDSIHVIDFKYGKGVKVSAHQNPQLMLYALGAYNHYLFHPVSELQGVQNIYLNIFQPRMDNVSSSHLYKEELLYWAETYVRPRAYQAFEGIGEWKFTHEVTRWSRVAKKLVVRAKGNIRFIDKYKRKRIQFLTEEELSDILDHLPEFKSWIAQVEQHALSIVKEQGKTIPGYAIKNGRKIRKIDSPQTVIEVLKSKGYSENQIIKKQLKTIGELEKIVGKKQLQELISGHISYKTSKEYLGKETPEEINQEKIVKKILGEL